MQARSLLLLTIILSTSEQIDAGRKKGGAKKKRLAAQWAWAKKYDGRCEACRALVEAASIGLSPESVAPVDQAMRAFKGDLRQPDDQRAFMKIMTKEVTNLGLCNTHVFRDMSADLKKACDAMLRRKEIKEAIVGMLLNTLRLSAVAPTAGPFEHMLNSSSALCSTQLGFCDSSDWLASHKAGSESVGCSLCRLVLSDWNEKCHRLDRSAGSRDPPAMKGLLAQHCHTLPARRLVTKEHVALCEELVADSEDEMQQAARLGSAGARMALLQRACAAGPCGGAEGGGGREL